MAIRRTKRLSPRRSTRKNVWPPKPKKRSTTRKTLPRTWKVTVHVIKGGKKYDAVITDYYGMEMDTAKNAVPYVFSSKRRAQEIGKTWLWTPESLHPGFTVEKATITRVWK